ncbi:MAG: hypothetical protein ABSF92_01260 [Candidatus Acidiferrales bacterium]|jgi:hypothetical protein
METHTNAQAEHDGGASGNAAAEEALYALSDEQILQLEPSEEAASDPSATPGTGQRPINDEEKGTAAAREPRIAENAPEDVAARTATASETTGHDSANASHVPAEPPRWLADMMADPQAGGEARDFWNGIQKVRQEASAYREVFARPEEARAAAEGARQLEELDRAYFSGDAASRTRFAETLLRNDPAAFREMVFAGLKALEASHSPTAVGSRQAEAQRHGEGKSLAAASLATEQRDSPGRTQGPGQEALVTQYAAFERAANEDLERNVGSEIGRVLEQALPSSARAESAPVRERLSSAIRQEIESALRGDRNLSNQVAQVLSARQFDEATRAQVVRLIGDRARQLVPVTAKRVLNEWTQTAVATHRARTQKTDAAAARRDVEGVSAVPGNAAKRARGSRETDYRRLTDEQILDM